MNTRQLVARERSDLVDFLRTLSDADWLHPSLCTGWAVRDVVGHLLYDAVPPPAYVAAVARHRGSIDAVNQYFVEKARKLTPQRLVDKLESTVDGGAFARIAPGFALADVLVHHQDIRRPLGRPRTIEPERLSAVLGTPDPFAKPGRWTKGLRYVATDLDWSTGAGPEVRGPGEALVLMMTGRSVVLDELSGEGVEVLRARVR